MLICCSTKAQLTQASFYHTDSHFVCNLLSPPHFYTGKKVIPPFFFHYHHDWGVGLKLWTVCQTGVLKVLSALTWLIGNPKSPGEVGGWGCMHSASSLVWMVKALLQWTKVCESTTHRFWILAFQPVENFYLKHAALRPP